MGVRTRRGRVSAIIAGRGRDIVCAGRDAAVAIAAAGASRGVAAGIRSSPRRPPTRAA